MAHRKALYLLGLSTLISQEGKWTDANLLKRITQIPSSSIVTTTVGSSTFAAAILQLVTSPRMFFGLQLFLYCHKLTVTFHYKSSNNSYSTPPNTVY